MQTCSQPWNFCLSGSFIGDILHVMFSLVIGLKGIVNSESGPSDIEE